MKILLLTTFTFLFFYSFGQKLRFEHIGTESGLSQGTVWCIHQDKHGFIWMGTDDGLNKYDGLSFNVYKYQPNSKNSISDNSVFNIISDRDGNLWIATASGLNKFNILKQQFEPIVKDSSVQKKVKSEVRALAFDLQKNAIWFGRENGNLAYILPDNDSLVEIENPIPDKSRTNANQVRSILVTKDGKVWVGTNGSGLYCYCPSSEKFSFHEYNGIEAGKKITAIYELPNGNLALGTDGAFVLQFHKDKNTFSEFKKEKSSEELSRQTQVRSIIADKTGNLWLATYGGLMEWDNSKGLFTTCAASNPEDSWALTSNRLLSLLIDNSGIIWIGNYDNGINVLQNPNPWFKHYNKENDEPFSLSNNIALSVYQDKHKNLFIGTYEGLNQVLPNGKIKTFNDERLKKAILAIEPAENDKLWLATWGQGLLLFNPINNNIIQYQKTDDTTSLSNNTVLSIFNDTTNNLLWLGTFDGLNCFDKKKGKFTTYRKQQGLGSNKINFVTGSGDTLWIATRDGGFSQMLISKKHIYTYINNKDLPLSLSNNTVHYIYNADSVLFLATKYGLSKYIKQQRIFINYFEEQGLPNNFTWSVIPDQQGMLWISTNTGISRFSPSMPYGAKNAFRNFSVRDGLQGEEFAQGSAYRNPTSGEIFFGGTNGLNSFYPEKIEENNFQPPVLLTSFKLFDQEVEMDTNILEKEHLHLKYDQNFLSFDFVSLDYHAPQKNQYSYILEGLDRNWSSVSDRKFASYPDIKPGEYTLKIRATNSQGIWSKQIATFSIEITPPFWQTAWFITLVLIFIIVVIVAFIRYREAHLKEEKRILEETVAERTAELRKINQDITASIQYAKRIQEALIIPKISGFTQYFDNAFVLFRPKDIVSGDFFWYTRINTKHIVVVADCTGHGVPGAFMSIIGNNLLEKIINERGITAPNMVLESMKTDIVAALNQGKFSDSQDGMDMAIIAFEDGSRTIEFAGAYRPLIRISKGELIKYQSDKINIGGLSRKTSSYSLTQIELEEGDCIYLFSDGYPDQFGGPNNKKFLLKRLTDLMLEINHQNMIEQDIILEQALEDWIGTNQQVDDVLLMGMRF